jgi:hypothetical protein
VQTYQKFGGVVTGAVNVRIEGDVKKKKSELVRNATSVCLETLRFHGLATAAGEDLGWLPRAALENNVLLIPGLRYMVTTTEIKDNLFENAVEVSMMGMVTRDNGIVGSLPTSLSAFDKVSDAIQNGNEIGIAPSLYGNTPRLNILAQLFNDPCLNRDWKAPSPTNAANPNGFSKINTLQSASPPVDSTVRTISTALVVTDIELGQAVQVKVGGTLLDQSQYDVLSVNPVAVEMDTAPADKLDIEIFIQQALVLYAPGVGTPSNGRPLQEQSTLAAWFIEGRV